MKILVACEESQRVCMEFRKKGHEAYSCDIIKCSGNHPEWHIWGDALRILNGDCIFKTEDGTNHYIPDKWDMIVAFPPCTHLAVSGAAWFEKKRADGRQKEGIEFFCKILNADCDKIAVENPVNIISGKYIEKWFPELCEKYGLPIKPTQHIQPYEFGEPYEKKTCLWLKGLKPLKATNVVTPPARVKYGSGRTQPEWYAKCWSLPQEERAKIRSKTFPGVAKAMAEQWG